MNYAPFDRLSPAWSALVADGVTGSLLALWVLILGAMVVVQLLRAQRARDAVTARLRPGVQTVVGVVVNEAGAEGPPVALTIRQEGEQRQGKHGPFVVWREVRRDVRARPFYLRLDASTRVRVEPRVEGIAYMDDLESPVREPLANTRTRTARVDPGERVFVRGELVRAVDPEGADGGYRDGGARGLVLRPAAEGILVSSHPVDLGFRRRAAHHALFASLGLAGLMALQGFAWADYRALRRGGMVEMGVVVQRWTRAVRKGRRSVMHYGVEARLPDGVLVSAEVSSAAWLDSFQTTPMPFTVRRGARLIAQAGAGEVGVPQPAGVLASVVTLLGVFLHAISAYTRRAWYDRRAVTDREPGTL